MCNMIPGTHLRSNMDRFVTYQSRDSDTPSTTGETTEGEARAPNSGHAATAGDLCIDGTTGCPTH